MGESLSTRAEQSNPWDGLCLDPLHPQLQLGCTQTAPALPFHVSECGASSGEHRLALERRSPLKFPVGAGVGPAGVTWGARGGSDTPRGAPERPGCGGVFFKAASVILGCLTAQVWWQCHMFLPLTLHGVPQFLHVLILGFFFFLLDPAPAALPRPWLLGSALLLSSPLLLKQIRSG